MSVTRAYTVGCIALGSGSGQTVISQIQSQEIADGLDELAAGGSGRKYDDFIAAMKVEPLVRFSTTQLETALGAIGASGLAISSGTGEDDLYIYFQQLDHLGDRKTGSNHFLATVKEGIVVPETVDVTHGQVATVTYAVYLNYDQSNAPITFSTGQTMPTIAATDELFTVGPFAAKGTTYNDSQSLNAQFGINVKGLSGGGDIYNTFTFKDKIRPKASAETLDIHAKSDIGLGGAAMAAGENYFFLRKKKDKYSNYGDGESEHIKITLYDGRISAEGPSANDEGVATVNVNWNLKYDSSNPPLGVSFDQTIS